MLGPPRGDAQRNPWGIMRGPQAGTQYLLGVLILVAVETTHLHEPGGKRFARLALAQVKAHLLYKIQPGWFGKLDYGAVRIGKCLYSIQLGNIVTLFYKVRSKALA